MEILFAVLFIYGLLVLFGYGLGALYLALMVFCQIITLILPKQTKKTQKTIAKQAPIATKPAPHPLTTKEKIECVVGLVFVGYTTLLAWLAFADEIPVDVMIISWLVLSAIVSYVGNKRLKHLANHQPA